MPKQTLTTGYDYRPGPTFEFEGSKVDRIHCQMTIDSMEEWRREFHLEMAAGNRGEMIASLATFEARGVELAECLVGENGVDEGQLRRWLRTARDFMDEEYYLYRAGLS